MSQIKLINGIFYEELCVNAYRSIEFSLKALFYSCGITPKKTDDLSGLTQKLSSYINIPPEFLNIDWLNMYNIDSIYPNGLRETLINQEEFEILENFCIKYYNWTKDTITNLTDNSKNNVVS
jgi:HEPN domain-containing protein